MANQFTEGNSVGATTSQNESTQQQHVGGIPPVPPIQMEQQADMGNNAQMSAPSFTDILRRSTSASMLSPDGAKYVKEMRDLLDSSKASLGVQIRVVPLSFPAEALAICCGKYVMILIFSEAMNGGGDNSVPTVAYSRGAVRTMRDIVGSDAVLLNTIVVTPRDYNRAANMAAHLINSFQVCLHPEVSIMNIDSFNNVGIEISTNPSHYEMFVERMSVHSTQARADIKIVFYLADNRKTQQDQSVFNQAEHAAGRKAIASLGAYVVFNAIVASNGMTKYVPEIHISEITSQVIYDGILPMILSLATELLVDNGYWKSQFADIGGKNTPNVGNLIYDQTTNSPWFVENAAQRDTFFAQLCTDPLLVLDVVEGRARIPGIECYSFTPDVTRGFNPLVHKYNSFMNSPVLSPDHTQVATTICREFGGYFAAGSKYEDLRWCDYLNLMVHNSSSSERLRELLVHQTSEKARMEIISQFVPNYEVHFMQHMVMLRPEAIRPLQNAIRTKIRIINGTNYGTNTVNMASMLNAGQFVANGGMMGGGYMNANPFAQLYGPRWY